MGSTATDDATEAAAGKAAKRHGKNQPASDKKPASGKPAAKKNKAAAPKSSTRVTADQATAATAGAESAAAAASDPRSLAWMSARAVSALNAVREHQAEQARELLARAEKPPTRHTAAAGQTVEHSEAAAIGKEAGSVPATPPVTAPPAEDSRGPQPDSGATPAAAASPPSPDTDEAASSTIRAAEPEQPATRETPAAPAAALPQDIKPSPAPASGGQQHVIPPAAPRNRWALRPAVLAGMLAVAGLLIYGFWPADDAAGPAAVPDALMAGDDDASIVEVPPAEVISVVAGKPARPAAAAATGETWNPATEPAWPEPEAATGQPATAGQSDPVSTTPQRDKTAPASAAVATDTVTTAPAGDTVGQVTVQPAMPVQPAATAQPVDPVPPATTPRPTATQPRYQAPGYGQYPQQPGWQQPYYRQTYPQYPSR